MNDYPIFSSYSLVQSLALARLIERVIPRADKPIGDLVPDVRKISTRTLPPKCEVVFIAAERVNIVLVAGTDPGSLTDIITDADFRRVPHPFEGWGDKIHAGFLFSSMGVALFLINWFRQHGNPDAPIIFTGHSMGGGIVNLLPSLVYPMLPMNVTQMRIRGFATPKCAGQVYCDKFRDMFKNTLNYVTPGDPVPFFGSLQRPGVDYVLPQMPFFSIKHPLGKYISQLESLTNASV